MPKDTGEAGMDCEFINVCPFFKNNDNDSKAVELLKTVYCQGNQKHCARYMILKAVGRENIPHTLYPNQTHLVAGIIKKTRSSFRQTGDAPE
jgi:hypothetical protein